MKILVVSDSHKNFAALKKAFDAVPDADTVVHLGDGEREFMLLKTANPRRNMIFIGGNCDEDFHRPWQSVDADGHKIFCCHGNNHDVHKGVGELVDAAKHYGCDIALYGHTHVPHTEIVNGVYVMNPGSLESPRDGSVPSFGILTTDETGGVQMEIKEL